MKISSMPQSHSGKVQVGTLKLAYEQVTPAESQGNLLLLTGLGATKAAWYGHLTTFGRQYRTVAMDHRDAGGSDNSLESYTTQDQAHDAAAVIKALNLAPSHVIGVSMGGYVAMELALGYPELVSSLILVCTSDGAPSNLPPTSQGLAALEWFPGEDGVAFLRRSYPLIVAPGYFDKYPERLQKLVEGMAKSMMPYENYQRQKATIMRRSLYPRVCQLAKPTLILNGEDDPVCPVENARELAQHIPSAKLITYPDCGHLVTMEKSREFTADVLAFLKHR